MGDAEVVVGLSHVQLVIPPSRTGGILPKRICQEVKTSCTCTRSIMLVSGYAGVAFNQYHADSRLLSAQRTSLGFCAVTEGAWLALEKVQGRGNVWKVLLRSTGCMCHWERTSFPQNHFTFDTAVFFVMCDMGPSIPLRQECAYASARPRDTNLTPT